MASLSLTSVPGVLRSGSSSLPLARVVGFFFIFRISLTFLFFQTDPVLGTVVTIGINLALLYGAILYSAQDLPRATRIIVRTPVIGWIVAFLFYSLASVSWTGALSAGTAMAYWADMAADVGIILLLSSGRETERNSNEMMKGAVWGGVALSLIAWCSPTTADLRLGNDLFFHPNTLGLVIAIATLLAQYLATGGARRWKWLGIALAITLLRTLSKTAIIAFVAAELWYLLQQKRMPRRAKMRIGAAALVVLACFWGLLNSYVDVYNSAGSGNQAQTLTGRTVLWATAFAMASEKPWFGHGLYAFRALIPAFGSFEPWHAHNEALQLFFEFGLVGLVIGVGVYWTFYRQVQRAAAGKLKMLAVALLIFALLHGLTDAVPFGLSYPLWLLTTLSLSLHRTAATEVHVL